uniref:Uncharacterized protein n=1 Tax=Knipowitschia caucasica TaxID=637954 RepID=A0AAV2JR37_KNICA
MHSLAISEKHDDDLEAANDLQNSMIEMEEAVCWEDDDSDEDYVPFLYLRSTGASRAEIDKLPEIHIDEAVLDVEEVPIVPEEDQHIPVRHKVETVEDLVGKEASICYNDNLLSLARYMQLPSEYCLKPVEEHWKESREKVLNKLRQKTEVVVLGDGRMDSPGHCAQFCTYTMIEHETRDIVHIVSEDKRRFGRNSVILEKVCFENYNYHNGREHRRNRKGEKIYRRYYNKKSKKLECACYKGGQEYAYIPDLQKAILRRRLESGSGLPRRRTLSEDDPERLGLVGTADTPPPTAELVARHTSRGAMALLMED